jgi:hypothetical protein
VACIFIGIAIDHGLIDDEVIQAANFMFEGEKRAISIRIDNVFEAKLALRTCSEINPRSCKKA